MAPVTATRAFHVPGYATCDGFLFIDTFIRRSAAFNVGGYDWSIRYYPCSPYECNNMDLCLRIETMEGPEVTASFSVSILDPTGGLPPWKLPEEVTSRVFDPCDINNYGREVFVSMPWSFLQDMAPEPRYLTRGGLLFHCTITVFPPETTPAPATPAALSRPKAPESDMMEQLGKIYETKDGADVTYSVKGKLFRAHKIILAMRSPVFKAQLYGGMMESTAKIIEVEDMLPDVFEALVHYIYTDALPGAKPGAKHDDEDVTEVLSHLLGAKDDGEVDDDVTELISHLLVASDRYGVERLRILCEHKLCDLVDVENWVRMLVFAEEQQCQMLKDACVEFMAISDRVGTVVVSQEYAQLRRTHPLILIDALEKSNEFRTRTC